MNNATTEDAISRIFFTAPWEPITVRRGDPLGLRVLADRFADALAPDLNNRISDGRWVTLLAWSLVRSHEAFHASGGRELVTRQQQTDRYAWLKPLELLWVARTIGLAPGDWRERPLPGRRRVRRWYELDDLKSPRFAMTTDQFRAYRQTGVYGGYRLAFKKWPGMTLRADGWTPGVSANRLAKWLDNKLGEGNPASRDLATDGENSSFTRSVKLSKADPTRWWLRQWPSFDQHGNRAFESTLPRPRTEHKKLPEADLLLPLLFGEGNGQRRLAVVREIHASKAAERTALLKHLAKTFSSDPVIKLLPQFSDLADAGIAAMELIAEALKTKANVKLTDIEAKPEAISVCKALFAAAQTWQQIPGISGDKIAHIETANRFAKAFTSAQPSVCLLALLVHHEAHGGGLRWFVLRNGTVEPRTPPLQGGGARYGFRLWSLCRLAVQCGVLAQMPDSLTPDEDLDDDLAAEPTDE